MPYLADERDVQFNLFEYLKIQELKKYPAYASINAEDLQMLLGEALKFAQREIEPLNKISDREGCRFENGKVMTPPGYKEVYSSFAANGFIGIDIPTTYGGQALPASLAVAMAEYFMGACFSFMMFPGLTRGAGHLIETFGAKELADLYCPKMYSGEWSGTMCLTEPQAGSAVGDLKTTARKTDRGYLVKGQKIFISCGDNDFTSNVIHMVLARVEGDPEGTKGISLFLVPKIRVNPDGSLGEPNDMKTVNIEEKLGIHGSPTCTLAFGDHDQCIGYLIGEQSKGMTYMFQMMNEARVMTGMQGLATGSNAHLHAVAYAKERIQGGKTTIVHYPDVRRMLSTTKAYVEGMRALLYKVGLYIDLAKQETDAAQKEHYQGLADLLTPVCKAFCSDKGFEVTTHAMQAYGGYGYISEYPIEQMLRDVKISSIYEGSNGIQALDLIGRKMTLKGGELFKNFYDLLNTFANGNASRKTLEKEFATFKKALDTVGQTALKFAEIGMAGDRDFVMLNAYPFLSMMGYLAFAWLLLEQALVALPKLETIWAQANADSEEKKSAICENNLDARFYEGKVKTARFYIWNILPNLHALAKGVLSEDRSALKIRF
jgi:alkylation response protein AidB-like acyl-CoA dehydrogenase